MKKKFEIVVIILFVSVNAFFGIQTLLTNNDYSALEERKLTQFSKAASFSPLKSEFYNELTDAFADQFGMKNEFISQYFYLNSQVFQQKYLNDVVIGKDGALFGDPYQTEDDVMVEVEKIAQLVNEQADEMRKYNTKLIYISYTRKDAIMIDYLPSFYNNYRDRFIEYNKKLKSLLNDNVIFVDLLDLLETDKSYYYRGDHHLNIEGQQILYDHLNEIMIENKNPKYALSDYQFKDELVEGSFDRKVAYQSSQYKETLYMYPKTFEHNYLRYENNKKSNLKIMNENSKYAAFMSGDRGKTKIINKNAKKDFKILFSGSSFLNSLEYLYIPTTSSFLSIDYRHNKEEKTLMDYVKDYQPQYVIYTASTSESCYDYTNHLLHFGLSSEDQGN